jgi:hypothetical protein
LNFSAHEAAHVRDFYYGNQGLSQAPSV